MFRKPFLVEEQIHIDALFSLFIEKQPMGFHFPGETHDFWECLYVLKGSACVSGDDKVYNLAEGDLVFHKPMELHKFYIDHKDGATLLIFSFRMKGPLTDYFKDKVFHLNEEQAMIMQALLSYAREQVKKSESISLSRKAEQFLYGIDTPLYLHRISTYLHQLFLILGEAGSISRISTNSDALLFQHAVQYMKEHIRHNSPVPEIALHCNISESGLKRLFSKYAGMSIHKYFLTLKFQYANELLQSGMNVSEVSEALNFSSQSYFSVAFKREFGKSPSFVKTSAE